MKDTQGQYFNKNLKPNYKTVNLHVSPNDNTIFTTKSLKLNCKIIKLHESHTCFHYHLGYVNNRINECNN